ncbi:UDP-glucose iridoid glucosyltransferase-like [Salvia miltiorrhiza]|uniref:UDP-glucose iridoid glucosyltransferase-like n=1 Tax=Salvia miltiorrhiza TaxID=226208 RepID=UPI0025ABED1E|nr:UDP-glucose iridoid glucosyltransferase-like [Salvia miltiorrhiza]
MEKIGTRKLQVMLVPLPLQGHLTPMLQLASVLHSRGFSVIVAHTEFNSPNPGNHPDFAFIPLQNGVCSPSGNLLEMIATINTNCKEPLEKCIVELQGQVSCIIYDSLLHFVDTVAHHLKVPTIFFRPSTAVYMQSYHALLSLHEKMIIPLPESHLEEAVPELHPVIRFKDLPLSVSSKIRQVVIDFVKSFSDIKSSVAVIWNSVEMLDDFSLQHQYQVPFFPIGPLHKMASSSSSMQTSLLQEDAGCIAWLDKQALKSVLYVSLGSLATMNSEALVETAMGIANSGQPFLWAIRPSSVAGSEWIECLPQGLREVIQERGLIVKWAPQKEVLAHPAVGGFLSHCGWNSTLESVCEGVAMICRPFFGDQMINARFLIHVWEVGVEIGNVADRKSIEEAVRVLMVDDRGKETRRRAAEMKHKLQLSRVKDGSSCKALDELAQFITSLSPPK